MTAPKELCIYCRQKIVGVHKGEHVVPRALGVNVTIRKVCVKCNNNELSQLDKELVSASPLHIVASKELSTNGENIWDYSNQLDLALEGRLVDDLGAVVQWPQVVFDDGQLIFCYDVGEMEKVGLRQCRQVFHNRLLEAVHTVRRGDRRPKLRWCSLPNPPRRGRFPPRVFARHSCDDLHQGISFECRYHGEIDKEDILATLERWYVDTDDIQESRTLGVIDPEVATSYRPRWVLRALVKIGINLLAYVMGDEFPQYSFGEAIDYVRYDSGCGPSDKECGFLEHGVTTRLGCPENAHKLTLQHDGNWALDCSFFGGIVGATVCFPGPSWSEARRIDIIAPIGASEWEVQKSQVLVPRDPHVTDRIDVMMPSTAVMNVQTHTRIVRQAPYRQKPKDM